MLSLFRLYLLAEHLARMPLLPAGKYSNRVPVQLCPMCEAFYAWVILSQKQQD